jgi:ribosomal protein S27AE
VIVRPTYDIATTRIEEEDMRCPACGHLNPSGSHFCVQCGAAMARVLARRRGERGAGAGRLPARGERSGSGQRHEAAQCHDQGQDRRYSSHARISSSIM